MLFQGWSTSAPSPTSQAIGLKGGPGRLQARLTQEYGMYLGQQRMKNP